MCLLQTMTVYDPLHVVQVPSADMTDIPGVRTVDPEILCTLFQDNELARYLFPMGFVSVISWFFDPLISNVKHIQKQRPHVSISATLAESIENLNSVAETEESQLDSMEEKSDNIPRGLLVICTHFKNPTMIYFNVDIYGKPKQSQEDNELRPVIFHGLKHAISVMEQEHGKLPLALGITTDDDAFLQECKSIVAPLGFQQVKMGAFESQNFFEQEFEKLVN